MNALNKRQDIAGFVIGGDDDAKAWFVIVHRRLMLAEPGNCVKPKKAASLSGKGYKYRRSHNLASR